jgi:hypothetical protein
MTEFIKRLLVTGACLVLVLAAGVPSLLAAPTAPFEAAASGVSVLALAALVRRWHAAPARPAGAVTLMSQTATRLK